MYYVLLLLKFWYSIQNNEILKKNNVDKKRNQNSSDNSIAVQSLTWVDLKKLKLLAPKKKKKNFIYWCEMIKMYFKINFKIEINLY